MNKNKIVILGLVLGAYLTPTYAFDLFSTPVEKTSTVMEIKNNAEKGFFTALLGEKKKKKHHHHKKKVASAPVAETSAPVGEKESDDN